MCIRTSGGEVKRLVLLSTLLLIVGCDNPQRFRVPVMKYEVDKAVEVCGESSYVYIIPSTQLMRTEIRCGDGRTVYHEWK